jgi:hypothetical protein
MDKKARQLMDELLALKAKADELAEEQRAVGEKIREVIERHQLWIEGRQAAEGNEPGGD